MSATGLPKELPLFIYRKYLKDKKNENEGYKVRYLGTKDPEFTYVSTAVYLALVAISHPKSIESLVFLAEHTETLRSKSKDADTAAREQHDRAYDYVTQDFIPKIWEEFPAICIDEKMTYKGDRSVAASTDNKWQSGELFWAHSVRMVLNSLYLDDCLGYCERVEDLDLWCKGLAWWALIFCHEIAHTMMRFLGKGGEDTPETTGIDSRYGKHRVERDRYSEKTWKVYAEAGCTWEMHTLGGLMDFASQDHRHVEDAKAGLYLYLLKSNHFHSFEVQSEDIFKLLAGEPDFPFKTINRSVTITTKDFSRPPIGQKNSYRFLSAIMKDASCTPKVVDLGSIPVIREGEDKRSAQVKLIPRADGRDDDDYHDHYGPFLSEGDLTHRVGPLTPHKSHPSSRSSSRDSNISDVSIPPPQVSAPSSAAAKSDKRQGKTRPHETSKTSKAKQTKTIAKSNADQTIVQHERSPIGAFKKVLLLIAEVNTERERHDPREHPKPASFLDVPPQAMKPITDEETILENIMAKLKVDDERYREANKNAENNKDKDTAPHEKTASPSHGAVVNQKIEEVKGSKPSGKRSPSPSKHGHGKGGGKK